MSVIGVVGAVGAVGAVGTKGATGAGGLAAACATMPLAWELWACAAELTEATDVLVAVATAELTAEAELGTAWDTTAVTRPA